MFLKITEETLVIIQRDINSESIQRLQGYYGQQAIFRCIVFPCSKASTDVPHTDLLSYSTTQQGTRRPVHLHISDKQALAKW